MMHKPPLAVLAGLTAVTFCVADSKTSEAQLLRRVRDRIQSRIVVPQPPRPVGQPPQAGDSSPQSANSSADAAGGSTPRRVAPVDPATSPEPKRANRPALEAPQGAAKATSRYGNSILAEPGQGANASNSGQPGLTPDPASRAPLSPARSAPGLAVPAKASLGIQVIESREFQPGLKVTGINPKSLADEAGLQVGDLIVAVDGRPTDTIPAIGRLLAGRAGGDTVRLRILRSGNSATLSVPLVGGPPSAAANQAVATTTPLDGPAKSIGLQFTDVESQRGALVTKVEQDSPAAASGLQAGDRIVAVDGRLLIDARSLQETLSAHASGDPIELRMVREGKLMVARIESSPANTSTAASGANSKSDAKRNSPLGGVGSLLGGLLRGAKSNDEMALEDDEPVKQAGFEESVDERPAAAGAPDPLALEALELPAPADSSRAAESSRDKSVQQLRQEIEELQKRLKELEEKNQ